jgi:eukaryotic-like serine/threonine-protein kinase
MMTTCPNCQTIFSIDTRSSNSARYCPFCRSSLHPEKDTTIALHATKETSIVPSTVSFLDELLPQEEQILFSIGPYQALKSIGKGGMGEVFLAYDTSCGRRLALKKIRPDLLKHKQLHNRFIKEARITSQLTHPAIIPIYAIHSETEETYYTMPYVEGETLKQLLRNARKQEKKGKKMDHTAESIPALIRIFLSICQAVAYSHSKHILHRDLKPENIIIGQYGQIIILDWGLAKVLKEQPEEKEMEEVEVPEETQTLHHLTHIGKVVGTIAYMAPERAMGQPANFQTDIYSLGVILYQMLTLVHPFHRESLKEFRKKMKTEKLIDPTEIAPYRDVPKSLSRVVMKCLAPLPENRYQTVDDLIHDLENYIEGRSEWFQIAELNINQKGDWEFQENVYIAEHVALTRGTEASDWVNLMISKDSFQETIKIEARVKISEEGNGIGFLLSIPEAAERQHLNDGYCLWIGTENNRSTKLLRSTLEVMNAPDVFLKQNEWYDVRIEKLENNIHLFLNNVFQFSYISHLPLAGTHIGLLLRDDNFTVENFFVYVGSQNVTVNCLAVPDAFLAHKDYGVALTEYRRIGYSFPGRAEGREAMFRAGITLLEQANNTTDQRLKTNLYDAAMEEFQKLHNTPGAPLEYLGKALIYQALGDFEEEAKCFELAYRRYPNHPLLPILQEQIVYRMHESSRYDRQATFNFILLTLKYLPDIAKNSNTAKLLQSLDKHWEPLFFIERDPHESHELKNMVFAIKLAFWLGRPYVLSELIDDLLGMQNFNPILTANALFCLIELGSWQMAEQKLNQIATNFPEKAVLECVLSAHKETVENALARLLQQLPGHPLKQVERALFHLIECAIDDKNTKFIHQAIEKTKQWPLTPEAQMKMSCYAIWAHLLDKNWEAADELLHTYPIELLSQETSLLHFLYGCWLEMTEGKEISAIHFSGVPEVLYPRTWTLASAFLSGKLTRTPEWLDKLFLWERRQLYRQLALHFYCTGENDKALEYQQKAKQEVLEITG